MCYAVSNPSIIHSKPSQQSFTASEDYYSLSGSGSSQSSKASTIVLADASRSTNTINRFQTPPSRYRTPLQSRDQLPSQSTSNLATSTTHQYGPEDAAGDEEVRKTPMRGEGRRRSSLVESSDTDAATGALAGATAAVGLGAAGAAGASVLRNNGVRRKPVPSTVMENRQSPDSEGYIEPARSSVANDIDRQPSPEDDTPYIRFAIDQLTRDEEVRGSRKYPGEGSGGQAYAGATVQPVQAGDQQRIQTRDQQPMQTRDQQPVKTRDQQQGGESNTYGAGIGAAIAGGLAAGAAAIGLSRSSDRDEEHQQQPSEQWPEPSRPFDERLPRPSNEYPARDRGPNLFIPTSDDEDYRERLDFMPGILRTIPLILFLIVLLAFLALLLLCAIWSLVHHGIFDYGSFGDSKYFTFEYLPTLLGMLLFIWLVQIEVAVYRIAPFIAMSSESPRSREEGAHLTIYPQTFLLPYFGHFRARQGVVGFFMFASWLQIWSIPLLASSFNVHFYGSDTSGRWRWLATTGVIWVAIGLYLILFVAVVALFFYLRGSGRHTGLKWDPRSLADIICLLERSNALSMTEDDQLRYEAPQLGYWRTSRGGPEVFQTYGVAHKSARRYSLENGRIREKVAMPPEPKSRFSDLDDMDMGKEQRHSREKMLPKHVSSDEESDVTGGQAVPWFLRLSAALLWIIMAIVLLLAFLVVSYLPSTQVANGFAPAVPSAVNLLGFSGTNFLYSFVPALLAMIAFIGLLDIDYAYRRLQVYVDLLDAEGRLAEESLLLSYVADLPGFAIASALANKHWRVAILSHGALIGAALPILAGGVFFAQFYVPGQTIRVYAHMPGFYALTVFTAVYAFTYLAVYPGRGMRDLDRELPYDNACLNFADMVGLVQQSKMLDDVAFHAPISKIDLVTRLLSAPPGVLQPPPGVGGNQEAAASKVSLADSVRGLGRARQQAAVYPPLGDAQVPRYVLGRYTGRDAREYIGVDRLSR